MPQESVAGAVKPDNFSSFDHLKISIVVGDLSKSGAGRWGGAVRPFLLAEALKSLGCNIKIIGFAPEDQYLPSTPELPIISIPHNNYPQFFKSIRKLLQKLDGDIIYAYKIKPTSFGVALLDKLKTGRPLLLDIDDWEMSWHGGDNWRYQPDLKKLARDLLRADGALRFPEHPLYLSWIEKLVGRADVVTMHTQFLRNRFGGVYVPNGKDVTLFDPSHYSGTDARQRYQLSDYQVLMFPGAPRPYKGIEDVLVALEHLNQPHLKLVIVGGSPYDQYDAELMERWGQWLIKIPSVPYHEMPALVAAADLIVVPQRDTPAALAQFPLKLTDGMAMAKPILATRVGDIPTILGDTGFLVDPSSPDQIATAIQHILAHPEEAKSKGQQARIRCVEHYSIQAMATALVPVLQQVAARTKPSAR